MILFFFYFFVDYHVICSVHKKSSGTYLNFVWQMVRIKISGYSLSASFDRYLLHLYVQKLYINYSEKILCHGCTTKRLVSFTTGRNTGLIASNSTLNLLPPVKCPYTMYHGGSSFPLSFSLSSVSPFFVPHKSHNTQTPGGNCFSISQIEQFRYFSFGLLPDSITSHKMIPNDNSWQWINKTLSTLWRWNSQTSTLLSS